MGDMIIEYRGEIIGNAVADNGGVREVHSSTSIPIPKRLREEEVGMSEDSEVT